MGLWMNACRTEAWSFFSFMEVAAIPTTPNDLAISLKDSPLFQIFRKVSIPFSMLLFSNRNRFKYFCNFVEAFVSGDCGKSGIQLLPFVLFASSGGF
jgi:hypothetical protein